MEAAERCERAVLTSSQLLSPSLPSLCHSLPLRRASPSHCASSLPLTRFLDVPLPSFSASSSTSNLCSPVDVSIVMRPHSSTSSSSSSSTHPLYPSTASSYSFGSTTSPPRSALAFHCLHHSTLPVSPPRHPGPVYSPSASSPLPSPSSSGWLSYAETSLAGLTLDQEDARIRRAKARRRAMRDRVEGQGPSAAMEGPRAASPVTLPTLPLSPPSPLPRCAPPRVTSPPLMALRPSVGRQLWPSPAARALVQPRRWDGEREDGGDVGGRETGGRAEGSEGRGWRRVGR